MHVELHERRVADILEAMHLPCFDHEDVAGAGFELVSLRPIEPSLEDVFVSVLANRQEAADAR